MQGKLRVGVIFGGRSGEHEVSIRSARSVMESLDRRRYEVVPIAISRDGKFLSPGSSKERASLEARARTEREGWLSPLQELVESEEPSVNISSNPGYRGIIAVNQSSREETGQPLDVVFPVLHGTYGEDGTIQGLLEIAGLPYVGCGVLASACGMDKVVMKTLFRDAGLPICRYTWFLRAEWEGSRRSVMRRVTREIGYPCFVKPANLGSSVGISRAIDASTLGEAIDLAARYDRKIIVEEGLDVREIECAVLGNDEAEASLPGEYVVRDKNVSFLDYTEKYANTGHVEFVVPSPLPKNLIRRLQQLALRAFKSIDGAGLARVDFFLRRDSGELLINELNTMPGLTDVSGYPKMWAASGLSFPRLMDRLIDLALERHADKSRNATTL